MKLDVILNQNISKYKIFGGSKSLIFLKLPKKGYLNFNHPNSNSLAKILLPEHTIIGTFFVFDNPIQINQSILSYIHHIIHHFSEYLIGNE